MSKRKRRKKENLDSRLRGNDSGKNGRMKIKISPRRHEGHEGHEEKEKDREEEKKGKENDEETPCGAGG